MATSAHKGFRLSWKVALLYFFMNVISISLVSVVILLNYGSLISDNTRYQAKDLAENLVEKLRRIPVLPSSEQGYTEQDRQLMTRRLLSLLDSAPVARYSLFDQHGLKRSSDGGPLPSKALGEALKARVLREQAGADFFLQFDHAQNELRLYIPLDEFGLKEQNALLQMDLYSVGQSTKDLYRTLLFSVLALSLLHVAFALLIYRILLAPISALNKATRILAQGDYQHQVPVERDDELGELAQGFNHMTGVIREQIDQLQNNMEDLRSANQKIHEMAITDELTGLYNRHHLHTALQNTLHATDRYHRSLGFVLLDIDHFKRVNDTYGHSVGDLVLRNVSNILRHTVRQSDLVARYGGEEMVVVLPETDAKGALITAEKIRVIIANTPIPIGAAEPLRISVSLGISEYQDLKAELGHPPEIKELVNAADEALYRAKENGRNQVIVHEATVAEKG